MKTRAGEAQMQSMFYAMKYVQGAMTMVFLQSAIRNDNVWICLEVGKPDQALEHGLVENKKKHIRCDYSCSRGRVLLLKRSILDEDVSLRTRDNGMNTEHSLTKWQSRDWRISPHPVARTSAYLYAVA